MNIYIYAPQSLSIKPCIAICGSPRRIAKPSRVCALLKRRAGDGGVTGLGMGQFVAYLGPETCDFTVQPMIEP